MRKRVVACSILTVLGLAVASSVTPTAQADPHTKRCGTVRKGNKTLRLRAANMSCAKARRLIRARTNNRAQVVGNTEFFYSASDCEGIVWRRYESDYSQAHGRIPNDGQFVRFVVTRGCVG